MGWAVIWVVTAGFMRVTLAAPEVCPEIDEPTVLQHINAGADWIVDNQQPNGRYLYHYDRQIDASVPGYNLVRHAGATLSLYQLSALDQSRLGPADAGMGFLLDRAVDTGNGSMGTTIQASGRVKTGAVALTLVSLAHRRLVTSESIYDGEMRALGRFLVGQQLPDGGMLNFWDPNTGAPVPEIRSRFATGEAAWGLAMLHEAFPDEGWDAPVWSILDYLATERDELEGLWPPPWADQWAAYTLAETAEWGLGDHHLEYAQDLAARFGQMIRWDSQREGVANLSHLPMPRGGGYGTILEGLAALQSLATHEPRLLGAVIEAEDGQEIRISEVDAPLRERLLCGAARLIDAQETDGAWYYDNQTRVDDQQHAVSGLLLTITGFGFQNDGAPQP